MADRSVPDDAAAERGYLTARKAGDRLRCMRELMGMTVWLAVASTGSTWHLLVTSRDDEPMLCAYTSAARVGGVRTPQARPGTTIARRFRELVLNWPDQDGGLVINPDDETELRIPRHVLPDVRRVWEDMRSSDRGTARTDSTTEVADELVAPIDDATVVREVERRLRDDARSESPEAIALLVDFLVAHQRLPEAVEWTYRLNEVADAGDSPDLLPADTRRELALFFLEAEPPNYDDAAHWIEPNTEADQPLWEDEYLFGIAAFNQDPALHPLSRSIGLGTLYSLAERNYDEATSALVAALVADGRAYEAEEFLRERIELGHLQASPLLANLLADQGRGDEADLMMYRIAGSDTPHGRRFLLQYLEAQGRDQEAEKWRSQSGDVENGPVAAGVPDIATVVATATITTALVPFIQSVVAEAAKDTYQGTKALIRRLRDRTKPPTTADPPDAPDGDDGPDVLLVADPELRITVHLDADLPLQAVHALNDIDVAGIAAASDRGHAHLRWDSATTSWHIERESTLGPPERSARTRE